MHLARPNRRPRSAARRCAVTAALGTLLTGCTEVGAFNLPLAGSPVSAFVEGDEPVDARALIPHLVRGKVVLPNATTNTGGRLAGRWLLSADATPLSGTVLHAPDSTEGTQLRDGYRDGFTWELAWDGTGPAFSVVSWKDGNVDGWVRRDYYNSDSTFSHAWRAYVKDGQVLQRIWWDGTSIDSLTYDPVSGSGTLVRIRRCAPNAPATDSLFCAPEGRTERAFQRDAADARNVVLVPHGKDLTPSQRRDLEFRERLSHGGHSSVTYALYDHLRHLGLQ